MSTFTEKFNDYMIRNIQPQDLESEGKFMLACCNDKKIQPRIQAVFEKMGFHVMMLENFIKMDIRRAFNFMHHLPSTWCVGVYFYVNTFNGNMTTYLKMTDYQDERLISTTFSNHDLRFLADHLATKDITFYIDSTIDRIQTSFVAPFEPKQVKIPFKVYMNKQGQLLETIEKIQDYRIETLLSLGAKTVL